MKSTPDILNKQVCLPVTPPERQKKKGLYIFRITEMLETFPKKTVTYICVIISLPKEEHYKAQFGNKKICKSHLNAFSFDEDWKQM